MWLMKLDSEIRQYANSKFSAVCRAVCKLGSLQKQGTSVAIWLKAVSVQDICNGQVSGTLLRGRVSLDWNTQS